MLDSKSTSKNYECRNGESNHSAYSPENVLPKPSTSYKFLYIIISLLLSGWLLITATSLGWDIYSVRQQAKRLAEKEALANFNKDMAFRLWGASHGGVYVPIDENTPPNPNLSHIPERDIVTPSGKKLTLMNPAYMIRQLMEQYAELYGIKGRITALKVLNPLNTPDEWEHAALEAFLRGEKEVIGYTEMKGEPFLRLMRPMVTKKSCLMCHVLQGYKEGDIRGGVGVAVPLAPYFKLSRQSINKLVFFHLVIGLLGIIVICTFFVISKKRISDYITMTKILQENEERFRSTFEQAAVGIAHVSPDGKWLRVNQRLCNIMGYTREELLKSSFQEITHPDDLEKALNNIRQMLKGQIDSYCMEKRYFRKDGDIVWINLTVSLVRDRELKPNYFISVIEDISQRKQADADLQEWGNIFEHAAWGIVTVSGDAKNLELMNPAFAGFHGYTVEELTGRPITDVFAPEALVELPEQIQLANEKGYYSFEALHIRKDGSVFPALHDVTAVKDGNGNVLYWGVNIQDITERKQAQQEKEELLTQLRQAQKMEAIGTLAGGIAHDFNNILSAVLGYTELAEGRISNEHPARNDLKQVFKAGIRAKELVKQILAFSRQAEEEFLPIKIHLTVKEALKLLRASIPTTIEIRQDIDPECGSIVSAPTQIHQLLMNLCTNAKHAMQEHGGILSVSLKNIEIGPDDANKKLALEPGPYIRLAVGDTGCGIERRVLERIFDPYFTTKKKGEGTGLGLAIVHSIVKKHQGHISVYSELGQGTTIHVYLPRIDSASTDKQVEAVEPVPLGREFVLVVDDEAELVEMISRILQKLGYKVKGVTTPEEALRFFQQHSQEVDLVITDMTMPNMTGMDLGEKLMEIEAGIPIILCTGFSELINAELAKERGFRAFIMKPVVIREIATVIRKVLDND